MIQTLSKLELVGFNIVEMASVTIVVCLFFLFILGEILQYTSILSKLYVSVKAAWNCKQP